MVDYQSPRILSPSSQCYYHLVDTSAGGLLVPQDIIPQQSVLLSFGRYLCWWIISPLGYYPPVVSVTIIWSIPLLVDYQSPRILSPSSQCYYHLVDTSAGGLLVPQDIIPQQSVLLSFGRYLCWWIISPLGYYPPVVSVIIIWSIPLLVDYQSPRILSPSSQCYYHLVDTSAGGLLVPQDIIPQQSVLLSFGRYLCWWIISPLGYYPPVVSVTIIWSIPLLVDYQSPRILSPSSQCYYHLVDTSAGGLLVPQDIIPQQSVLLSFGRYLCWWIISPLGYYPPVVSVTIIWSIPLLVDYQSRYLCWWIISPLGYYPPVVSVIIIWSIPLLVDYQSPRILSPSSQCYYHLVDTSAGGLLVPQDIIPQQSVLLSFGRYLCWWIISPLGYYPPVVSVIIIWSIPLLVDYQSPRILSPSSQCYYHLVDTSAGGLLVPQDIIPQQSVLLSFGRYLCWWIISPLGYYPPVVSVIIIWSIPLLVDYQSPRILSPSSQCYSSFAVDTSAGGLLVPQDIIPQQSVLLSFGRYLCWWIISPLGYYPPVVSVIIIWSIPLLVDYQSPRILSPSSQCYYHLVDTSAGGLLVPQDIIPQQSVLLSFGRYLCWWIISPLGYYPPVVSVIIIWSIPLLVDYQSPRILSPSSQCYYHLVDTSAGGLLVSVIIIWSIPLLVDYQSPRILSPSSQCYYHLVDTSAGGLLVPQDIIPQQSVLLSFGRYLCWWIISPLGYYPSVVSVTSLVWFIRYIYY